MGAAGTGPVYLSLGCYDLALQDLLRKAEIIKLYSANYYSGKVSGGTNVKFVLYDADVFLCISEHGS